MFHIRHFRYQLFHFNKFINGKGLFSNCRTLSTINGGQFSAIRNRNGRFFIVQSKYQKLCQQNQFCSGNNDDLHLFPVENENFSSNISSPETSKNNTIEHKEQNLERTEKHFEKIVTRWLELDNKKQLKLELEKGKSGQKFFRIELGNLGYFTHFRHILVPEDAYAFVRALDEIVVELAAENFEQKLLQIQDPKSIIKIVNMMGHRHKFHLELMFFPNENQMNGQRQICLGLKAVNKITMKERRLHLPLKALPWLRKQMAEMLAKFDGTEPIEKETPAQIPPQFFHLKDVSSNPHGQRLSHKGMRPQFANKMPTSFQKYSKMPAKMQNSNHIHIVQQKPNLKRPKMTNKNSIGRLEPQMTALEQGIRTLFDFDDKDMENYRRIAAKTKYPSKN